MALNLNSFPYFDDFDPVKGYQKILFNPAKPVQARELTQIQSILQEQIKKNGDFTFKNGTMVIPGHVFYDDKVIYLKIEKTFSNINIESYLSQLVGTTIIGDTNGIKATIVWYDSYVSDSEPTTLYIKYISGSGTTNTFMAGETFTSQSISGLRGVVRQLTDYTGKAAICNIGEGVFYVNGYYVGVAKQTKTVSKYSNTQSAVVGLNYTESIITENEDPSLNDNAFGFSNYNAPGSHRLKVSLALTVKDYNYVSTNTSEINFIELIRIKSGGIELLSNDTKFAQIESWLARRTYEESGDFVTTKFKLAAANYRNNDRGQWLSNTPYLQGDVVSNAGNYYIAQNRGYSGTTAPTQTFNVQSDGAIYWGQLPNKINFINGGITNVSSAIITDHDKADDMMAITTSAGNAFVQGFEKNFPSATVAVVPKARNTKQISNAQLYEPIGMYVVVDTLKGLPNVTTNLTQVQLLSVDGLVIGSAWVRALEFYKGDFTVISSVQYKLFLFNISVIPGFNFYESVHSVYSSGFSASIVADLIAISGSATASGAAGSTITGVGSYFDFDLDVGDRVRIGTTWTNVVSINSPTTMTVSSGSITTLLRGTPVTPTPYTWANISITSATGSGFIGKANLTGGTISSISIINPGHGYTTADTVVISGDGTGEVYTVSAVSATITAAAGTIMYRGVSTLVKLGNYVVPLAAPAVHSIRNSVGDIDTAYTISKYYPPFTATGTTNTITLAGGETFIGTTNHIVVLNTTLNNSVPVNVTYSLNVGATSLTIGGLTNGASYTALCLVRRVGSFAKEKTKTLATNTLILTNTGTQTFASKNIALPNSDCIRLIKVTESGDATNKTAYVATGEIDITQYFTIDTGQRSEFYDIGRLFTTRNNTRPIRITYDYLQHSAGDYFSVDSYSSIPRSLIGNVSIGGTDIYLPDYLDFRNAISNDGTNFNSASAGTSLSDPLVSTLTMSTSYSYFLPRVDTSGIDISSGMTYNVGESFKSGMQLAQITVNPYTFDPAIDVTFNDMQTMTYTMKDIQNIDKRVENVEYYVALNEVEKETINKPILDKFGLPVTKNGFLVDGFHSFDVTDVNNPDWKSAISTRLRICHSLMTKEAINLVEPEGTTAAARLASGYQITGNVVTLPYTEVAMISQTMASTPEDINQYKHTDFTGQLDIYPNSDAFVDNVDNTIINTYVANDIVKTNNVTINQPGGDCNQALLPFIACSALDLVGGLAGAVGGALGGVADAVGGLIGGIADAFGSVICTKTYQKGLVSKETFLIDSKFGEYLLDNNPDVYLGYLSWARTVVSLMDGRGPNVFFWIKDDIKRREYTSKVFTTLGVELVEMWTPEMSRILGYSSSSPISSKVFMFIAIPICKLLGVYHRKLGIKPKKNLNILKTYILLVFLFAAKFLSKTSKW